MTSDNCRKEEEAEAYIDERGQYLLPSMTSAVDVAGIKENPSHENRTLLSYRPTIESLVRDWNIQEALKAVKRNKGASGKYSKVLHEPPYTENRTYGGVGGRRGRPRLRPD